ncbi:hypothetical protein SEA_PAVLO_64 [Microbacterium phage Pavlo]|nr:hypothetical protein SEA_PHILLYPHILLY_64 [Microbacterium phage PhillyPhilly]UVG34121.1 hypothetical protein SEA_PAVLO_64 [Microbacterium phage Pavlo]
MSNFKVGDRVIRTGSSFEVEGMIQGREYVVSKVRLGTGEIYVQGNPHLYEVEKFKLAPVGDPDDSPVEHPKHYNSHPSGVECITIARHHNFNIGNAFKYLWRIGLKGEDAATKEKQVEEIDKAIFYLQDERERILSA